MDERPPPDPAKLLGHLDAYARGEELPGRTLANLKTGDLPDLLVADEALAIRDAWTRWEKGQGDPAALLADLDAAGLRSFLEARATR